MKKSVIMMMIGLLILTSIIVTSCSKKEGVIKIGVSIPLTGDMAEYGKAIKNGIELALEETNQKSKKKFETIYEDNKGEPTTAVTGINKLISIDKVKSIIGGAMSSVAQALAPICNNNKVILLSPYATDPNLTEAGPYFFRIWPSDTYDGKVMANIAYNKLGIEKIAILYVNNVYGKGISDVFTKEHEKLGGNIVTIETFAESSTDFRTQLEKIKNKNPEAIYLPAYIQEILGIIKQSYELGLKARFLGNESFKDEKVLQLTKNAIEGTVFSYPAYDPESNNPIIKGFVTKYKNKFNQTPNVFAALGYDCFNVLKNAYNIKNDKNISLQKSMFEIENYEGPAGNVIFDSNGDVMKDRDIYIIENNSFIILGENNE